ncbi:zinc finger protein 652-like [Liolophura sinensis]|uniref:zinc finger protein 652-like n=1 Tax=Liolophura sinensis TaxID=3198878 RepID=UPI003158074D
MAGGGGEVGDTSPMFCEVFPGHGDKLLDFFSKQRHDDSLCDCVLTVEGVEFPAHACVLGASSHSLLQQLVEVRKNNISKLSMDDVTYEGFYPLFEYMYSGLLKFEMNRVKDIQMCAQTLGLKDLDSFFEQFSDDSYGKNMCAPVKEAVLHGDPKSEVENYSSDSSSDKQGLPTEERDCHIVNNEPEQNVVTSISGDEEGGTLVSSDGDHSATSGSSGVSCDLAEAIENPQSADTVQVSNSDDVDTSGLDDYLSFFATLSANAEPIPAEPTLDQSTLQDTKEAPNSPLTPSSAHLQTGMSQSGGTLETSQEHCQLSQPLVVPSLEVMGEDLRSNVNESIFGTESSVRTGHLIRENIGTSKPGIQVDVDVQRKTLEGHVLPEISGVRCKSPEDILITKQNQNPGTNIADGNNQCRTMQSVGETGRSGSVSEASELCSGERADNLLMVKKNVDSDSQSKNSQGTVSKSRCGMKLRKRPASRRTYSSPSEEGSVQIDNSNRRVYVRSQAPFSSESAGNSIQFGANLALLLKKHGVSATALTVKTSQLKTVQKRKRTTPRKIHKNSPSFKKAVGVDTSVMRRTKKKKTEKGKSSTEDARVKAYNCPLCPRGFFREPSLKKHCEGHAYGGIHKCHVCSRSYVRLCDFTRHVRSHGTLRCEYCEFTTKSQKHFVDHNEQKHHSPKPFRCHFEDCNFASSKLHDLDEHRLIHSQVKCFSCELCGKTFAQKGGLYSHKKSCMQKRDFLCDICGRAFNHLGSMKSHRRIHVGEKPFECSECNARFSDHRNLKRHKRIHENAFPYACDFCDKRFRHSNSRKSHMTKQHFQVDVPETSADKLTKLISPMNPYLISVQQLPVQDVYLQQERLPLYEERGLAPQVLPDHPPTDAHYVNQIPHQNLQQ